MTRKRKSENQKSVSGCSKETSGAQKRNKKRLEEQENKKLKEQAAKHFKITACPDSQSTSSSRCVVAENVDPLHLQDVAPILNQNVNESTSSSESENEHPMLEQDGNLEELECSTEKSGHVSITLAAPYSKNEISATTENSVITEIDLSSSENLFVSSRDVIDSYDVFDPSSWPQKMSIDTRQQILRSSAVYQFDQATKSDISLFWKSYLYGKKANQELFERLWLRISQSTQSAFCLPCCFFLPSNANKTCWSNFGETGYQDFNHGLRGVTRHEESVNHLRSMTSWMRYLKAATNPNSLESKMNAKSNENIEQWRKILRGIVDAVLFLSQNNLAFRGSSSDINDADCGNFLNLIKLLSKYYAPLAQHVERLKKNRTNYLSPSTQNEFILLCGQRIKSFIINEVKQRKYYSILFDSTPDASHLEQVSHIIRYVVCSETGCKVVEHFLDFIATTAKTGAALSETILAKLLKDGLELDNCRGQGYDNGANMSGCYSGVQARISAKNPQAKFVPCAAHSLNLVGVNAAEKVLPAKLLLGTVQNIYSFFVSSPARWEVLKSNVKTTLKCQNSTRWSSKSAAVGAMCTQFGQILESLSLIMSSPAFSADVIAAAESRYRDISNFRFLLGLTIWNQILFQLNSCNISLQSKEIDVSFAEKKLNILLKWLADFKESGFESSYELAKIEAEKHEIELDSGFTRRGRGINSRYDQPQRVASVREMSNTERFKLDFFETLMKKLIEEMTTRFSQIRECTEDFGFLFGNGLKLDMETKINHAKDLCLKYPNDFNSFSFCNEIQTLGITVEEFLQDKLMVKDPGPLEILNLLYTNGLDSSFPNCETALRIFLTLPISVASNERAFSKLKLIKNYLRSSMGQERLNGLAIISIEKEISAQLDFDEVINDFVTLKNRRVNEI